MEMVEDVAPSTVHTEAEPTPKPPRVGSLTKVHKNALKRGDGGHDMPEGDWNKFARDYSPKKAPVQISSYSKEEATRRKIREKERRELQERNAKLMQLRAEEEAARQKQEKERVIAERKAWAQAKLEQRRERISRAAEERKKRDEAYCQLLETTRERGLLFVKLHAHGEELVAAHQRQKLEEYRSVLAPAKKVAARDIRYADDLHPSLRAVQRCQQQNNIRRETDKMPLAFSPKHVNTGPGGFSPFSSAIGERRMPGSGSTRFDSSRDLSPQPRRRANKLRHTSPARTRGLSVDRASSPVALPGVEITVRELPSPLQAEPRPSLSPGAHKESAVAQPGQAAEKNQQVLEERDETIANAGEGAAAEAPTDVAREASEPEAAATEAAPEQEASPEAGELDSPQPEEEEAVDKSSAEASEPAVAADPSGELEEDVASPQQDDTTQGEDRVSGEEEGQESES